MRLIASIRNSATIDSDELSSLPNNPPQHYLCEHEAMSEQPRGLDSAGNHGKPEKWL